MKHYNRRERKALAKALGLRTKNESTRQRQERVSRSILAGNQISQQFQAMVENEQRQSLTDKYARATTNLAYGIPLRYSKREIIKEATYTPEGRLSTPAEYSERVPIAFSPGVGEQEAKRIMESNYKIAEKRRLDLIQRRNRQKLKA